MGYNIELSVPLMKCSTFSDIEKSLFLLAEQNSCETVYSFSETDGTTKIPRYHQIVVVAFEKDKLDHLQQFVKDVKQYKYVNIECIYNDNLQVKLIYATSHYLQTLDKRIANEYQVLKRKRSYSEDELKVITEVTN